MSRKLLFLLVLLIVAIAGCTALPDMSGDITAEKTESAELAVDGAPAVDISHFAGTITVREGDPGRVAVNVLKQSRLANEAEAQAQLDEVVLILEESGDGVRVEVRGPEGVSDLSEVAFTAELELSVPPGSDLNVELGAGEITLEQPGGDVVANNGAGEITVVLPADASFNLIVDGGVAGINSDFAGVPDGGVATEIDTTIGDNPTQTLNIELGAGELSLVKAP
jgi:hypothetical protein